MLVRLAADLLQLPEPVAVVLDDFAVVSDAEIDHGLAYLLRHAYPNFRLIILTRVDPTLPIPRYRLSGDVAEIRQQALAFTPAEVSACWRQLGFSLPRPAAAQLTAQTEGWAAGIRLATTYLNSASPTVVWSDGRGSGAPSIREYILDEVLECMAGDSRQFLRETSVSPVLTPALADELTGRTDGGKTLAKLAHANIFVEQHGMTPGTYRGTALIRETVLAEFTDDSPHRVMELHRRGAQWFALHGQLLDALPHAVATRDCEDVVRLVIDSSMIGAVLISADSERYADILASLPKDVPGAGAAVVRAAVAYVRRESERAEFELAEASRLVAVGANPAQLELSLAIVQGIVSASLADARGAVAAAAAARRLLIDRQHDPGTEGPRIEALVHLTHGAGLLWDDDLAAAATELEVARRLSERIGSPDLASVCRNHLALAEALRGRLTRAADLAQPTTHGSVTGRIATVPSPASLLALAWVHAERCDYAQARWLVALGGRDLDSRLGGLLGLINARLHRWKGDLGGARRLLQQVDGGSFGASWLCQRVRLEEAELHLAAGRADLATAVIDGFADASSPRALLARARVSTTKQAPTLLSDELLGDPSVPLDVQVEAWLHQGRCFLMMSDETSATAAIERANKLARPEMMRRPFLHSGVHIRRFLRQRVDNDRDDQWLDPRAMAIVKTDRKGDSSDLARPAVGVALTKREIEVLRYLADLRSTKEVASAMFVSVNTVRSHVRSILRKLDVPGRGDAVHRARQLQIV
jgi:LuxR family maltose regulon positive regulatory protein